MDIQLMLKIESAAGRNQKEALLRQADPRTREFIRLALDPYTTFGVTVDPSAVLGALGPDELEDKLWAGGAVRVRNFVAADCWWSTWGVLLVTLAKRKLTGRAASEEVYDHLMAAPQADHAEWAMRILHKDLRCGVNVKTLMKVFPGLVEPFQVMLAEPTADKHGNLIANLDDLLHGTGFVEPKFDGVRCTYVDGIPMSRLGNPLAGVEHITRALNPDLLRDYVVDGEVVGETRETSMAARRKDGSATRFMVFDLIPRDQWASRETWPLWRRKRLLRDMAGSLRCRAVSVVPHVAVYCATLGQMAGIRDEFIAQGYEGAMWKRANQPYHFKRTKHLLKFKRFQTEDYEIIGWNEGEGKYKGMLGALVCRLPNGGEVYVGSGFTDDQRHELWNMRAELFGMFAEVKYQSVKTTNESLSHPVFVRLRRDK